MNKETFTAGDEVYCPPHDFNIHTLLDNANSETYPLGLKELGKSFTPTGRFQVGQLLPDLHHATPENKALLEALYKCEFESPKLKGSDLTRKLLSEGKHVLCYCSNSLDLIPHVIGVIKNWSGAKFGDTYGEIYTYAVPCNDYANLTDGVLTLKSEQ